MSIELRPAKPTDAEEMSILLTGILQKWGSSRQSDPEFMLHNYIDHAHGLACTVALKDGKVVGFQALLRAWPDNPYNVPAGWGIIGTYVSDNIRGHGIGRKLFEKSRKAAQTAGLASIDATIGADNPLGLAYYDSMGFQSYQEIEGAIRKRYDLKKA